MATRTKSTSSTHAGGRSTTAASSRRASSGPVRVWSEASVTVAVTEDPPQFVKFTHGFEAMSPNDSEAAIKRTEEAIYKRCEEIVERRLRRLRRLLARMAQ